MSGTPSGHDEVDLILAALPPIGERGDEYRYASLPLCILEAVYNLGARYTSVQRLIGRYCERYGLPRYRPRFDVLPPRREQANVADLIDQIEEVGPRRFAEEVLQNLRPTSSQPTAVLRSEAVLQVCRVLDGHGISVLQDMARRGADTGLYRELCAIPGQRQGTAITNLFMLAGDTSLIKFDRMVQRFLERVLGRSVNRNDAQRLLSEAAERLQRTTPWITAGHLDYAVWERESGS